MYVQSDEIGITVKGSIMLVSVSSTDVQQVAHCMQDSHTGSEHYANIFHWKNDKSSGQKTGGFVPNQLYFYLDHQRPTELRIHF
jgi:hypothetical protein